MNETIERLYTVPTPCQFRLGNIRGRVEIQAGEEGVIHVTAVKHPDSGDAQNTRVEMSQAEDGSVWVETRYDGVPAGWFFFIRKPCRVDYIVRLPRLCSLRVSGVSSSASVEGVEGELEISGVSGPLALLDLSGKLRVSSVSGEVRGEHLSGELDLETVSGNARLSSCRFSSIRASTVSASLAIQTPLVEGPYRFHSVSGDVRLTLPRSTACTLTSRSISGSIVSDLYAAHSQVQAGLRRVEVQGGGPEVQHKSISGNLRLYVSDELPLAAAIEREEISVPAREPSSVLDQLEVLDRIDRGELTAEEALKILGG